MGPVAGGDLRAVLPPGHARNLAGEAFQFLDGHALGQIPDPHGPSRGHGGLFSIGLDGEGRHSLLSRQGPGGSTAGDVPDLGEVVQTCRGELSAVGREGHGQDQLGMPLEALEISFRVAASQSGCDRAGARDYAAFLGFFSLEPS